MSRVLAVSSLSLDGVMQAPGRPDEDVRGDFSHGGWALPYNDQVLGRVIGEGMARGSPLLLGRRTYEDFFAVWPARTENPFTKVLENTRKYVVSRTLTGQLPWKNSTLLQGEATDTVAALKQQIEEDLPILGSGELVRSLLRAGHLLLIHPLVLGAGRRLFADGVFSPLELIECIPTTKGS